MLITQLNEPFPARVMGVGRTKARETGKIHLTDVIRYIEHVLGTGDRNAKWDLMAAAEVGFLWEELFSKVLADRCPHRIGEVECDGIVGSPDGLILDPQGDGLVNAEYKATWKKIVADPEQLKQKWYWMTQFKSYCHMLGVTTTLLHVFWVMGDYRASGPVASNPYRIDFNETELTNNWEMIIKHKNEMVEKGYLEREDYENA